jgi:Fe-Mn family superoxide dismutase
MYKSIELDYNLDELNNFLESRIDIHFDIYQEYLNNLNDILKNSNYDFKYSKEELIDYIDEFEMKDRDDILYNLGGVLNHERYFNIMAPTKVFNENAFLNKINDTYGSFDKFKEEFMNIAASLVGSGYTNLVIDKSGDLKIINTSNQELPDLYGFYPLISLDLWEHAYFLKYYQNRSEYIDDFFDYLNYDKINEIYEKKIQEI